MAKGHTILTLYTHIGQLLLKWQIPLPKRKVGFLPKSELFLSFSQKVCFKRVFVLKSKFLVVFFISKASFLQKSGSSSSKVYKKRVFLQKKWVFLLGKWVFYVEVGLLFKVIVRKWVFNIISGFLDLEVGLLFWSIERKWVFNIISGFLDLEVGLLF